ncbi:ABC transporter ATP-binding protein [Clostridium sp. Marseille-P2415]|uniref:ABC transporter ATP-binding protein n=1 Tax=Clostridium sp. Marseille-P2415 TaxID=1805471 RepID=UPI0009886520|nr:sn-glycerol-3-phosphate ABC transporter ATP-binding protein UgpC [Clostridium sp. Marseille-P2415]
MASLSFVNVCKTYKNGQTVVKDFNLDIKDREFLILVGPSGCGKSTTLRMIAGLEDISSGELWIDGQLMNMTSPQSRDLSMVFQSYALYPHLSVYQNMAFGLKVHKIQKEEIDRRVGCAAEILHISHLLDRKPYALSGGQKQRVAIGSVIVRQPKAYLMDEPLSNLDAKLRTQMRVELAKIHRELGATIIYVTHDQVEAMTLGTRIVVMDSGVIQQAAAPNDLYQNPVNKFVAGFIGSPPMNFIPVWVERKEERICLEFSKNRLFVNGVCANRLVEGGYVGRRVYLGIRPEDFREAGPQEQKLLINVDMKEVLGAEIFLHGRIGRAEVCVRLKPNVKAESGESIPVYADMDRIKLFDMDTEQNILYV